ncbi:hypothetical protein GCM10027072_58410 [Streptomyces bullii]
MRCHALRSDRSGGTDGGNGKHVTLPRAGTGAKSGHSRDPAPAEEGRARPGAAPDGFPAPAAARDFDGPVRSLFGGSSTAGVARRIKEAARADWGALDPEAGRLARHPPAPQGHVRPVGEAAQPASAPAGGGDRHRAGAGGGRDRRSPDVGTLLDLPSGAQRALRVRRAVLFVLMTQA